MDPDKFAKIAESLRQFQRADLSIYEGDIKGRPIDKLYVDPLPNDAILKSFLTHNTTFLLGRKGTGKSTVFAKAQSEIRAKKDIISIYLDVKSIYDTVNSSMPVSQGNMLSDEIAPDALKAHLFRKHTLGSVISQLLVELRDVCDSLSIVERFKGRKYKYEDLMASLNDLADQVKSSGLTDDELPILREITQNSRDRKLRESGKEQNFTAHAKVDAGLKGLSGEGGLRYDRSSFERALDDDDVYRQYSDVVLRSFPFSEIVNKIKGLLSECGLTRLFIFLDDFSEIAFIDQRLFVDVVLSPLNNSSNESIKLKLAAYPGRVYYGKIDPGKVDTLYLDFCDLYEASEIQETERGAADYCKRLLITRFDVFGADINEFFDISSSYPLDFYFKIMFQASFNVPRIMGHILHTCYLDRVSRGLKVNAQSIRLASKKYYDSIIDNYFDMLGRFAVEPFENKLDRHNQKQLMLSIIAEAKDVRKKIVHGEVGGKYFEGLGSNPPVSHFFVNPDLQDIFSSLESNFLVSRYKVTKDKEARKVIVYALFYGLCESERIAWGYPEGRFYRNYFVQRCFDFTRLCYSFLRERQTIICGNCKACHPADKKEHFEFFNWKCPECAVGICSLVNLADDFQEEFDNLDSQIMLEPVELEIISTLRHEDRSMRASEISALTDTTYQFIGKRTSKLKDMGLIKKFPDQDNKMVSEITERCQSIYFSD